MAELDRTTPARERPEVWTLALLWSGVVLGLYLVQRLNFLLFHSIAEMFSIVIAAGVFLVTWNSRDRMDSDFFVVVGIAYAFVAALDAVHMLAYSGMGVFPDRGANLATQFWLAARYLESVSLALGATFAGGGAVNDRLSLSERDRDVALLVVAYGSATAALVGAISLGAFPDAYLEGSGLTRFKILSEYLIAALLSVAMLSLYRDRAAFERRVFRYLALGLLLTIGAELAFTLYVSVYGFSNMIGHLLKIASFYLIYLAVIKTGISNPQELLFRQLREERDALAEREAQLERQNQRLDEFASIVSHDLRNPLNVARGRLQLAREERDGENLAAVAQSHDRMEALIGDLLTLARNGETVTEIEPVDLAALAETCWRTVDTEGATLVTETDAVVHADSGRLQQLLENLFRNATEHGGSAVTIRVGELDDREGFHVADDGPGIPTSERERAFESGYSTADHGTGFGLTIVRQIADAHGWGVAITESRAGGARFEITTTNGE
jgi:signal transduction histidine kinase